MSVESFAHFLEAIGHRIVRSESSFWYDAGPRSLLSMPSQRLISPTRKEIDSLLKWPNVLAIRFAAPLAGAGKSSFQIVCDNQSYGLDHLSANVRSKVRRGMKRCDVRRVPFEEIAGLGARANRDTLQRQGRDASRLSDGWGRYWAAATQTQGMEGWGAFVGEELAAFLVSVELDDCVEFLLARSRSDLLDAYPNNALLFSVTEELLCRRRVREITFGLESVEPVGSLDDFKFSMGFRRKAIRQRVEFHPVLAPIARLPIAANMIARWAPDTMKWRKTAGLLRFAQEATT